MKQFNIAGKEFKIDNFKWNHFLEARDILINFEDNGTTADKLLKLISFPNIKKITIAGEGVTKYAFDDQVTDEDIQYLFEQDPNNAENFIYKIKEFILESYPKKSTDSDDLKKN